MAGKLYWRVRWALSRHTMILHLFRLVPSIRHAVVTRTTDLLIEGYPRSGNTFARNAFMLACNHQYTVSSHLHFIANVKRAIELKIPVLILIRRPVDAVSSYWVYRGGEVSVLQCLHEYVQFYDYVRLNRRFLVVASFDEVTDSFGNVIEKVNLRYDTSFPPFEHSAENVQKCHEIARSQVSPWHADKRHWSETRNTSVPVEGRDKLKHQARALLDEPKCRHLLREADRIYGELTDSTPSCLKD